MVEECRVVNGKLVCDPSCYVRQVTAFFLQILQKDIQNWYNFIEKERNIDLIDISNRRIEQKQRVTRRLEGSHERIYSHKFLESRENLRPVNSPNTYSASVEDISSISSSSLPQEPLAALSDLMADLILNSEQKQLNGERLIRIILANQKMLTCLLEFQQIQNAGDNLTSESFSILSNHLYNLLVEIFDDSTSGA